MRTVLVTGEIGSGKSEVCRYLASKGFPVYDSDSRTKALYDTVPGLLDRIEETLGDCFRREDGSLDRKKLGSVIFTDPEKRHALESVVYPEVVRDFTGWRDAQDAEIVFLESAIALEKKEFDGLYDCVLAVTAPYEERLKRNPAAAQRSASQHFDPAKADVLITNDADLDSLHRKIDNLL